MNRRNFLGTMGAAAASAAFADPLEKPVEYETIKVPHSNPIGTIITDPDELIRIKRIEFNTNEMSFDVNAPATMRAVYSAARKLWSIDNNLVKYDFPFIAITSEIFEVDKNWNIGRYETIRNIRKCGLKFNNNELYSKFTYVSIELLSEKGLVFDNNFNVVSNGGLILIDQDNNKILGYYQLAPGDKFEELTTVVRRFTDTDELTYMRYRIV